MERGLAGRINDEDIETLRQRADALVVIGDFTELKRAGRNWKGLCPFHTEKTPSFNVMASENRWYCFGCSEGGDLFDFLRKIEGLTFVEAVESLARRSGITLRYEELSSRQRQALGDKAKMLDVTRAGMAWFQAQLLAPGGAVAREYLKSRGFGREDAERFHVGFAPDSWDALTRHLTEEAGFTKADVQGVRLAKPNNRGGLRDAFKARLIFPILDVRGDPIGFGGRVLPGIEYGADFTPPKYLNSEEYRLYQKTRVLYGVHEARQAIVSAGEVLVCEGYTDVMALHQAGFSNAVATCGTAVGPDHFRTLSKYANRIVLAFDGDNAGKKAARKAYDAAREVDAEAGPGRGFQVRVLVLPDGSDPAELVRQHGVEEMQQRVTDAPDVIQFLIRGAVSGVDVSDEDARIAALREAVELLGLEADPDRRRVWARTEVATLLGVSIEFVAATARRAGVRLDTHTGVARGVSTTQQGKAVRTDVNRARAARERAVLRFAMQQPAKLPDDWYELSADDFSHPRARAVFEALAAAGGAGVGLGEVVAVVAGNDAIQQLVQELAAEQPDVADSVDAASEQLRMMRAERLDEQHRQVTAELGTVNAQVEGDRVVTLLRELQTLEERRRRLRAGPVIVGGGDV
jgi:DNA primase